MGFSAVVHVADELLVNSLIKKEKIFLITFVAPYAILVWEKTLTFLLILNIHVKLWFWIRMLVLKCVLMPPVLNTAALQKGKICSLLFVCAHANRGCVCSVTSFVCVSV